jgi:hypothetical protein
VLARVDTPTARVRSIQLREIEKSEQNAIPVVQECEHFNFSYLEMPRRYERSNSLQSNAMNVPGAHELGVPEAVCAAVIEKRPVNMNTNCAFDNSQRKISVS